MVKVETCYLPSSDGKSQLHMMHWSGDCPVKAVLQISHGMIEHIGRYDEFARTLAEQGIAVAGHDHLGHGKSSNPEDFGFFAEENGHSCVIKDIHRVSLRIAHLYPDVPHFILGHSMGSFFLRRYLTVYGQELSGAVIMGTGDQPSVLILAGLILSSLVGRIKGPRYRSPFLHNLVLGGYNKNFAPVETPSDWLSRDRDKVAEYVADPYCSFFFTCSAYQVLFQILRDLKSKRLLRQTPKELPVFLVSGDEDPVGDFGKGVIRVFRQLKRIGLTDVTMKLYPESRHEILNEINRECVYEDIASWVSSHLGHL
ncbi:MAG: alpha/beta fold hydrolase [Lachnospiraceae bacterium]